MQMTQAVLAEFSPGVALDSTTGLLVGVFFLIVLACVMKVVWKLNFTAIFLTVVALAFVYSVVTDKASLDDLGDGIKHTIGIGGKPASTTTAPGANGGTGS